MNAPVSILPQVQLGETSKLGARVMTSPQYGQGVNFAFYTHPAATSVSLCLFDEQGNETRLPLFPSPHAATFMDKRTPCDGKIWSGFVPGIRQAQRYGLRVDGPFKPEEGLTFHPQRLLMDPYALEIDGTKLDKSHPSLYNYDARKPERFKETLGKTKIGDTAAAVPKSVVIDVEKILETTERGYPLTPSFASSRILETHVREATINFDKIPKEYRGTFKGLSSPGFIAWMKEHAYNTLELMPVMIDDQDQHWGYMSSGFFALNPRFAVPGSKQSLTEQFAEMVQTLRREGIETWMDVVYNHTAEGNEYGPVFGPKGFDERFYRKHDADDSWLKEKYFDTTGTGNTLNTDHPMARQMLIDSLVHFRALGVSGFRFDLMKALGRSGLEKARHRHHHEFYNQLLDEVRRDGRLEGVTLVGEPWDCHYFSDDQAGLPQGIAEWQANSRDVLRKAAFSPQGVAPRVLSDVLAGVGFFIKYAVSHDGPLPADSVRTNHAFSGEHPVFDCGQDAGRPANEVEDERFRRQTFLLALEALSQGATMHKMGAERGHSQGDKPQQEGAPEEIVHNPYDLASESVTRIPWRLNETQQRISDFDAVAGHFKKNHDSLRRRRPYTGHVNFEYPVLHASGDKSITWIDAQGQEMTNASWNNSATKAFGYVLSGETGMYKSGGRGGTSRDTPILALINPSDAKIEMKIPPSEIESLTWRMAFDSSGRHAAPTNGLYFPGQTLTLQPFTAIAFESAQEKAAQKQPRAARSR